MTQLIPAEISLKIEQEKKKAKEALEDVRQLLSHADEHTGTRSELVRVLRERADFIEDSVQIDQLREEVKRM